MKTEEPPINVQISIPLIAASWKETQKEKNESRFLMVGCYCSLHYSPSELYRHAGSDLHDDVCVVELYLLWYLSWRLAVDRYWSCSPTDLTLLVECEVETE